MSQDPRTDHPLGELKSWISPSRHETPTRRSCSDTIRLLISASSNGVGIGSERCGVRSREEEHYVDEGVGDERGDGGGFELGELGERGSKKKSGLPLEIEMDTKPNTHVVKLVCGFPVHNFSAYVENWRKNECESESSKIDAELGIRFGFKHVPPEMRLSKDFRRMVKEWQRLPYVESYDSFDGRSDGKKLSMCRIKVLEKRAARTVEKMVEVEWISHFRKWHMIFLGEAYERGRLIEPNPVYAARRKIIHLVILGHRGMFLKEDVRTVREPQEAGFRAGEGD
ncbi:hypothetical protein Scep_011871 [Stephania cephalantha]|uniref:PORR domain-containing protein n=1 Tax=Stephania cephalantha TaxID=152367 RepID=A0AAP0JE63_9MAGN